MRLLVSSLIPTCMFVLTLGVGPLAPLYRFHTEAEVLERANAPRVGLAGSVFRLLLANKR